MVNRRSRLQGFGRITVSMGEVAGKHTRDYCVANHLNVSKFIENLVVEYLIKVGDIESREALEKEIYSYSYEAIK